MHIDHLDFVAPHELVSCLATVVIIVNHEGILSCD